MHLRNFKVFQSHSQLAKMKFSYELAIFAFFYLVIIILFSTEASAEPRGVQENIGRPEKEKTGVVGEDSKEVTLEAKEEGTQGNGATKTSTANLKDPLTFDNVATAGPTSNKATNNDLPKVSATTRQASSASQLNESNPLADLFQITDPNMRATMASIYGAYRGNDQCSRKAFCMLGNYLKDMPGRDLLFMVMRNYIPSDYSLYFEIFQAAVIYGQNCNVYVCIPDAELPKSDAASAARPKGSQSSGSNNSPNSFPR